MSGQVTRYKGAGVDSPIGITMGPDDALWFANPTTDVDAASIGRFALELGVVTGSLPAAQPGVAYGKTLVASDGVAPLTWSRQSGSLPPGLSLSSGGVISGVPTAAGSYSFVVKVTDSDTPAATATRSFSIVVGLGIAAPNPPVARGGVAYSLPLKASGGTAPYKWKKATKLPKGLKLNAKTGLISGIPKKGGVYAVTVRVTDKAKPKRTSTRTFTIVVAGDAPRRKHFR
jgi:hypothetical protein